MYKINLVDFTVTITATIYDAYFITGFGDYIYYSNNYFLKKVDVATLETITVIDANSKFDLNHEIVFIAS